MRKNWWVILVVIGFTLVLQTDALAQCAMCRATLENNVSNGDIGIAARLNYGILFLFALPYLLVFTIGILWYRKSKRTQFKNILAEKRREKLARLRF